MYKILRILDLQILILLSISYVQDAHTHKETSQSNSVNGMFFFSPYHLKTLVLVDLEFIEFLRSFEDTRLDHVDSNDTELLLMKHILDDFNTSTGKYEELILEDIVKKVIENPLLTFRMIYRFVQGYSEPSIHHHLASVWKHLQENKEHLLGFKLPDKDSLNEAMEAILRLCFTYNLNIQELSEGRFGELETGIKLHWFHTYAIGQFAIETNNHHALAVEWLELTLQLHPPSSSTEQAEEILEKIRYAVSEHDKAFGNENVYANDLFVKKIVQRGTEYEYDGFYRRRTQRMAEEHFYGGRLSQNYDQINMYGLCSGKNYQSIEVKSRLKCFRDGTKHPYWTIQPLKIEELSDIPHIIQLHHFITDNDAEKIIETATPLLDPSLVRHNDGTSVRSKDRTSSSTWLNPMDYPISSKLSKSVKFATGLETERLASGIEASEALQTASYTFGEHYRFHVDPFNTEGINESKKGNRIATFMFYLSDVEMGGSTVFVRAGIAVKPEKGSAVFWYNMLPNTTTDKLTIHGACPILFGGPKWVANKWINFNPQFQRKQCPSNFDPESFEQSRYKF